MVILRYGMYMYITLFSLSCELNATCNLWLGSTLMHNEFFL